MPTKTSTKELQVALGLDFPGGLSRRRKIAKNPEIRRLLDGLDRICNLYVGHQAQALRRSHKLRTRSNTLLHQLGPVLWPDIEKGSDPSIWLLKTSQEADGQHATRFQYSKRSDREA